jgi:hypothetical protein
MIHCRCYAREDFKRKPDEADAGTGEEEEFELYNSI